VISYTFVRDEFLPVWSFHEISCGACIVRV
jgi:hypothetical protein